MASIRRRKRAKRDVWWVDYRDGAGVRRRMTSLTREIAEDLLAEKIRESRQAAPEVIDREITLAAYAGCAPSRAATRAGSPRSRPTSNPERTSPTRRPSTATSCPPSGV
jgi:hypothetical protein